MITENRFLGVAQSVQTPFDAQITLVGIPADPPLGAQIVIQPRILETVSRTAGVYMITGCKDVISTNGLYTTTLDVYRIKSTLNDVINTKIYKNKAKTEEIVEERNNEVYTYSTQVSTDLGLDYNKRNDIIPIDESKQTAYTIATLPMYDMPKNVGKIVTMVPHDTEVTILAQVGVYCYTKWGNYSGYVLSTGLAYK